MRQKSSKENYTVSVPVRGKLIPIIAARQVRQRSMCHHVNIPHVVGIWDNSCYSEFSPKSGKGFIVDFSYTS